MSWHNNLEGCYSNKKICRPPFALIAIFIVQDDWQPSALGMHQKYSDFSQIKHHFSIKYKKYVSVSFVIKYEFEPSQNLPIFIEQETLSTLLITGWSKKTGVIKF